MNTNPYAADQVREFYETMSTRDLVRNMREHTNALCAIVERRLEEIPGKKVKGYLDLRAWGWGLVLGCAVSSWFWIAMFALYAAAHGLLCN